MKRESWGVIVVTALPFATLLYRSDQNQSRGAVERAVLEKHFVCVKMMNEQRFFWGLLKNQRYFWNYWVVAETPQ